MWADIRGTILILYMCIPCFNCIPSRLGYNNCLLSLSHSLSCLSSQSDLDPRAMQKCRQREAMLKGFNSAIPKVVNKSTFHREGVPQGSRVIAEAEGGSLSSVVAKVSVHGGPVSSNAGLIYNTLQSVADNR